MTDELARRLRTQAERDADGTTWRAAAQSRPGYATYPGTPPGSPSWWRRDVPDCELATGGVIDVDVSPFVPSGCSTTGLILPPPGEHDRCTRWCGFCHLGSGPAVVDESHTISDEDTARLAEIADRVAARNPGRVGFTTTTADEQQPAASRGWTAGSAALFLLLDAVPMWMRGGWYVAFCRRVWRFPAEPRRRWWHRYTRRNP